MKVHMQAEHRVQSNYRVYKLQFPYSNVSTKQIKRLNKAWDWEVHCSQCCLLLYGLITFSTLLNC